MTTAFLLLQKIEAFISIAKPQLIDRRAVTQWASRRAKQIIASSTPIQATSSISSLTTRHCSAGQQSTTYHLSIRTPEIMEEIASLLSIQTRPGDIFLLDGDLGAGKTTFSRGFIRARSGYTGRITSPTYLLTNEYRTSEDDKIFHIDLYRLNGGDEEELRVLDLENVFENGIALVEWPERLVKRPEWRLDVTLTIDLESENDRGDGDDGDDYDVLDQETKEDTRSRIMRLEPYGDRWIERLKFYETEGYFEDLIIESLEYQ